MNERLSAALADRYRVERELGAGGMATVYLADDLKHRRKVAIKVLREDLSLSVGGARFLREIEIAAQLQHPNILPLLDSGEAAGRLFYVMPYVEGQSLRQRLTREHELPVGEVIRLLIEVVDALSYAHQRGVVHRDIKPDNVMLTGRHAVVADFGVARAVSQATGGEGLTSMGVALGTPAYMAPEQATADPNVDQRADIYAIGVVAYELLAGKAPFAGTSPQQVLAAHVTTAPEPISRHRPGVPAPLEHLVMRCLEKLPADRFQTANELLAALEPMATPSGGTAPTSARLPAAARRTVRPRVAIAAAIALVLAFGALAWRVLSGPAEVALGRSTAVTTETGLEIVPAISPDGRFVAYSAGNSSSLRVFVRPVEGGRAIALSDDSTGFQYRPRWSPDGRHLLFLDANLAVWLAPAFGESGTARVLAPARGLGFGSADWSPTGSEVAVVHSDTLSIVAVEDGRSRVVAVVKDLNSCVWSPDSRWFACVRGNSQYVLPGVQFGNLSPSAVVLLPASGGPPIEITDAVSLNHSPAWAGDARRLYFVSNRDGPRDIYVQDLDRNGRPRGSALRVSTGLEVQSLSLTPDGARVAYSVYRATANIWSVPFPRSGPITAAEATPVTSGNQIIEVVRISRDGKWLVYDSNIRGNSDIWRMPITGGQPEQLTSEPFDEFAGDLSPDNSSLAYHSFRTPGLRQIEVKPLGGGPIERVTRNNVQESNAIWSPDGQSLVFFETVPPYKVSVVHRSGPHTWSPPRTLTHGVGPRWMRDGKSITFGGIEQIDGQVVITLRAMPADSGPSRVVGRWPPNRGFAVGAEFSADGRNAFIKVQDPQGHASIWSLLIAGGDPRLLVSFPDASRPSYRPAFATDEKRIFFPVEDRQSDIHAAEVVKK
jgi:Tol biopolymer transport system component